MVLLLATMLSAAVPVAISWISTRRRLDQTQADVTKAGETITLVKAEVKNSHSSNLRADIDDLGKHQRSMEKSIQSSIREITRVVTDLATGQTNLEGSLDRRFKIQERSLRLAVDERNQAMDLLRNEVPGIVKKTLEEYTKPNN